jgi:hypothetical protein
MWLPIRHVKASDGLEKASSAVGVVDSPETSSIIRIGLVRNAVVNGGRDNNCLKLQQTTLGHYEKENSFEHYMQNGKDRASVVTTCTSQELYSVGIRTNLIMRRCSIGTSKEVPPMGIMSATSTSTQREVSNNRGNRRVKGGHVLDQQRVFSATDKIFAPKTTIYQYRPRNLGGSRIKSVVPRTKPQPQ